MKVSVKDGKTCNETMVRKRLERFSEVGVVDRRMALDWILSIRQNGFWSITSILKNAKVVALIRERLRLFG